MSPRWHFSINPRSAFYIFNLTPSSQKRSKKTQHFPPLNISGMSGKNLFIIKCIHTHTEQLKNRSKIAAFSFFTKSLKWQKSTNKIIMGSISVLWLTTKTILPLFHYLSPLPYSHKIKTTFRRARKTNPQKMDHFGKLKNIIYEKLKKRKTEKVFVFNATGKHVIKE